MIPRAIAFGLICLGAAATAQAANNAAFVSQSIPTIMTPGQTYSVSVTMQNTGTTTWSSSTYHKLGTQNPQDNTTWTGLSRVALPNDVAPGQNVTFTFNVTAPSTPGMYNFQWKMVQDLVEWFGAQTENLLIAVGDVNFAQFVSQDVPAQMTANQSAAVSVTMKNAGSLTWSPGTYYLRSQNPQDNSNWGFNRVELASSVAPGQNATFNFNVSYPVGGTVNFRWQMAQDTTNFGDLTPNVAVGVVGTNNAAFVSQTVPTSMTPGQSYAVSVTLQNTGNTTWSSGNYFKLGTQNPQDNTTWTGLTRVALPYSVAPGQNVTFSFNVTAPSTDGMYNFQWRMVQDLVEWFGAQTPNVAIAVGAVNHAHFISQNVPTSMQASQSYPVSVTMRNAGGTTWNPGTHYLRSQNPQDNTTFGLNRVDLTSAVAPGQNVTVNFNATPPVNTFANFQWQMAQDTTNFGEPTSVVGVQIGGSNNAAFVSQNVPATMTAGQSYTVSLTMQNTGTNTWSSANAYKLGTQNAQDNTIWTGLTRVALPHNVAPGQNVTFSINVTAPTTPGTYNFQWKMVRDLVEWFGAQSTNVAVNVKPPLSLHFVHADHLNTPRLVANQSGQTVWRWDQQEPFGVTVPDENPSGLGAFEFPLRFPGQYADKETFVYYNYFRDYDPYIGRYVESDPIGLKGGISTYAYVGSNPLGQADPYGLFWQGLLARIGLQTIGSKWGNTPMERGAERERFEMYQQRTMEYEACIERCRCEPWHRQNACEDECVRKYKKRLEDVVFGQ
jgi:RHS repeat-associated protein